MQKLLGYWKLIRLKDIMVFYPILMVLSMFAARVSFDWQLLLALVSNLLIVISSFVINDIEDAEDDARDPKKVNRNPLSAKMLTKKEGYIFLAIVLALCVISLFFFNIKVILLGIVYIAVGIVYSIKSIRLKAMPVIDVVSHAFFLGGAQVLFFMLMNNAKFDVYATMILVGTFFSSMAGDFANETRDWEADQKAGLNNSANAIGFKNACLVRDGLYVITTIVIVIGVLGVWFVW